MKSFRFSLESVLEYRREIEEEWEIRLARVNGEYNRILLDIEENDRHSREALDGSSLAVGGTEAHSWGMYRWRLESQKVQLLRALAAKEEEQSRIRRKFLEVTRDRKIISRLKEKKMEEYKKYLIKEEIKRLDDLTAAKSAGEAAL
ncbi:MAG: flagellar export protein FliJ [Spirochaetales bacterium]|nr:flagellar export protein FliJ [Spirochaetales bacterium]